MTGFGRSSRIGKIEHFRISCRLMIQKVIGIEKKSLGEKASKLGED